MIDSIGLKALGEGEWKIKNTEESVVVSGVSYIWALTAKHIKLSAQTYHRTMSPIQGPSPDSSGRLTGKSGQPQRTTLMTPGYVMMNYVARKSALSSIPERERVTGRMSTQTATVQMLISDWPGVMQGGNAQQIITAGR